MAKRFSCRQALANPVKSLPPSRRRRARLALEPLETRSLLSASAFPSFLDPVFESNDNDTIDRSQDLGNLTTAGQAAVLGAIGEGLGDAADVDWYRFTLERPVHVTLVTPDQGDGSRNVLSLYNSDADFFNDPFNALPNRLLAQDDGAASASGALISRPLAPGTYYLAVSGLGNRYFHPFLAGSGHPGSTGDYELLVAATDLGFADSPGPTVLASDPAAGAILDRSPLAIRIFLSGAIDPSLVALDENVRLTFSPDATFGDDNDHIIPQTGYNWSATANELQLVPMTALGPGFYEVFLAGNGNLGLEGQDYRFTFQVNGNEGAGEGVAADDTPATAHDLGDVTSAGLVQVAGVIGDDPSYDPNSADLLLVNPAADVDLYHFRIRGPGRYSFVAEVFAGRIGSRLNPGVSLFSLDAVDGQLHFLNGNDNTLNLQVTTTGQVPLYSDAALFTGLVEGDYYLAVTSGDNTPEAALNRHPGVDGIFDLSDPNLSHTGTAGATVGSYVLNLVARPDNEGPRVVSVSLTAGSILEAPPTHFTVQFSESVNLQLLAYLAYQSNVPNMLGPVWIQGADGAKYHPRLISYDETTNQATFLMLDALADGDYQLHLSGRLGLMDFADNALIGNRPTGDHVTGFTVQGQARGTGGDPLHWPNLESHDDAGNAQPLGALFPHEFEAGITVTRELPQGLENTPTDVADYYQFQVLQNQVYVFVLTGTLPEGTSLTVLDATKAPVPVSVRDSGDGVQAHFNSGTYIVGVSGWAVEQAGSLAYDLQLALGGANDNPSPLTVGPRPASSTYLVSVSPPPPPTPNPNTPPGPIDPSTVEPDGIPPQSPNTHRLPVLLLTAPEATPAAYFVVFATSIGPSLDTLTPKAVSLRVESSSIPPGLLATLGVGPVGGVEGPDESSTPPTPDHVPVDTGSLLLTPELLPKTNPAPAVDSKASPWFQDQGLATLEKKDWQTGLIPPIPRPHSSSEDWVSEGQAPEDQRTTAAAITDYWLNPAIDAYLLTAAVTASAAAIAMYLKRRRPRWQGVNLSFSAHCSRR